MLAILLILLVILWFLGYVRIQPFIIPNIALFTINGQIVTLWQLLIFIVLLAIVGALPSPFRKIAGVFLILWILTVLNILAIANLGSLFILAVIVGLVAYLLGIGRSTA